MDNTPKVSKWFNEKTILIISVFIAGLCSIIYELLISTTSSYFLGDSIKQFSITIGIYMAAMGIGSFLSKWFHKDLLLKFIAVEILLGFIGGISVPILYFAYAFTTYYSFNGVTIALILAIGILTGLEIPLLARIMKHHYPLKENLANVLSLDYLGALLATLLFPFILLPWLGTFRSSLVFGILNIAIGFLNLWYFSELLALSKKRVLYLAATTVTTFFIAMLFFANSTLNYWNDLLYLDSVIYFKETPYQNLILTKRTHDLRLYINGNIQFSSVDEYRYHESLVHIPLAVAPQKKRVLVLGGGEGLVAREVLKHPEVESITIVDIDPEMFEMSINNPDVSALNEHSLSNPKVQMVALDAFVFLKDTPEQFDVIISDLPDPTSMEISRLYSQDFFKLLKKKLHPQGVLVTQATSPFFAPKAYWCINKTIEASGFKNTYPYHAYVPTFGDWGFVMAADFPLATNQFKINVPTRYLSASILPNLFTFEKDVLTDPQTIEHSTLDQPVLLQYYLAEWKKWK